MSSVSTGRRRTLVVTAGIAGTGLILAACSGDDGAARSSTGNGGTLTIGTTDKIATIDPAGSYDAGSFAVMNQVYPFLMDSPYGSPDVRPDIAESASFTAPTDYTVKLKGGLKFANGHDLTSSDVKFSFDRMIKINDPNGPATLLGNLAGTDAPDPATVVFHLKSPNDQTFPQVLASPAGPIVDEQVFSPDKLTSANDIVSGKAFAGPYVLTKYQPGSLLSYAANPGYQGLLGAPKTKNVNVRYYANASNLKRDVQQGTIDVAFRSLSASDVADLRKDGNLQVVDGPGGEIRYLVFNFDTMPYGAKSPQADAAKALAVRQAIADVIDRKQIADQVYKNTYTPLYSYVPSGLTGATDSLKGLYGNGSGGPDTTKARTTLSNAGVQTPVLLSMEYTTDYYGPSSGDEYALIKKQLEASGLFTVDLRSTDYVQYAKERVADVYPIYQLDWFPDYPDADDYLTPFFSTDNFLHNHYASPQINTLIQKEATTQDATQRTQLIQQIQDQEARDLSTLPYLQGSQVAVVAKNVRGIKETLDASFKFRYGALSKG